MRGKELLERVRVRPGRVGGDHRTQELHEFLSGAHREAVDGMSDDIGVDMLAQVKAHCKAARAGTLRVVVGNGRDPGKSDRRTVTGVESRCRCGARVSDAASEDSANAPVSRMPFACAGLNPE